MVLIQDADDNRQTDVMVAQTTVSSPRPTSCLAEQPLKSHPSSYGVLPLKAPPWQYLLELSASSSAVSTERPPMSPLPLERAGICLVPRAVVVLRHRIATLISPCRSCRQVVGHPPFSPPDPAFCVRLFPITAARFFL